ncbi:hypothetical protein [Streptomyces sp. NPDC007205]|uniref:hypothetical protein n=1 Tax=Streptomyces sp. NPDC007205 TaxID=3154316 RepID=UPI0034092CD8
MDDETSSTRLLGAYWLDLADRHPGMPCCFFGPAPQQRVRGAHIARAALTVAVYGLILTALALTAIS